MLVAGLQAEHVARQVECADLPAAIVQHFVDTDAARDHFVEILCILAFAVNLLVATKRHGRTHDIQRGGESMIAGRAWSGGYVLARCMNVRGVRGDRQHNFAPQLMVAESLALLR